MLKKHGLIILGINIGIVSESKPRKESEKMKQKKNNVRWLVACRLPKEKVHNMRAMGFKRNEIFGFPTKRAAFGFMKEVTSLGAECAFARS